MTGQLPKSDDSYIKQTVIFLLFQQALAHETVFQFQSKNLQYAFDVVCTFINNYKYLIKEVKFSVKFRLLSVSSDHEWGHLGDRMDTQKW